MCLKDDAYTDLYTAFATGELRATPPTVLCSVPLKHIIQENGKFCGFRFHPFLCRCRTGMVIYMKIDTNTIISVTEANQNFSRVTRIAEKSGQAVIFKNNRPRYMLIDLENSPILDMTEDEKIDVVAARVMKRFKPAFQELAK